MKGAGDHILSLPARIQRQLMRCYGLEGLPSVDPFVAPCNDNQRERLLVRTAEDAVEMTLQLPLSTISSVVGPLRFDHLCQVIEGVSHFLLVAERARRELPTTQLELELQAEVDKFVVLSLADGQLRRPQQIAGLRRRLFEGVRFLHRPGTENGDRYRLAHRMANQFIDKLERDSRRWVRPHALQSALRQFYRMGQTAKLSMARAA